MASGLRRRGHTVWLGFRSAEGDLQWHDGETFVGRQRGPGSVTGTVSRIPGLSHLLNRLLFLAFLFRIRGFIKQTSPQIVQLNPGSLNFPWVLKMFMPANIHFIFDIRHLNVGIRDDVVGRFREWLLVQDYWLHARFIYNHACFNHEHTAQLLLGKTWHKWATVVPVGLDEQFFTIAPENGTAVSPAHPLQFIYVGAITRFRALETIFEAAQLARQQTDRFRILQIDHNYQEKEFPKALTEQLLTLTKALDRWVPGEKNGKKYDTYYYLNFKIVNGKIAEILP